MVVGTFEEVPIIIYKLFAVFPDPIRIIPEFDMTADGILLSKQGFTIFI